MKTYHNRNGGGRGDDQSVRCALLCVGRWTGAALAAGLLLAVPARAQSTTELPTGGTITSGAGSINQTGSQMTVTQTTDRMIALWGTFNIGQDASVQFNQPGATSVALNRIQDQNASQILGSLKANGQVFLINPSGIYFGKNATVNVGSLVASSLNIADADFLAGKNNFAGSTGSVVNAGNLSASKGGIVALLSPVVSNEGTITAAQGGVALAAGNKVNIDFGGDGMISLTVDEAAINAQATNKGLIKSDGGMVIMTAKAAGELVDAVVNNTGVIEANTLSNVNGRIILDGGESGIVESTGTLAATGNEAGQTGGTITVTGEKVGLFDNAVVDASGQAGGGTINIGGGFQGKDSTITNAKKTFVGIDSVLKANAGTSGNGGRVVVWSDEVTKYFGRTEVNGGSESGNGGLVEISSKSDLNFVGQVYANSAFGAAGTLLLDPQNIIVATGGAEVLSSDALAFATNAGGLSTIDPVKITDVTNTGAGVTLQATDDITVNNGIVTSGTTGGSITFQAGRSIILNSDIHSANGAVSFTVNDQTATGTRTAGAAGFTNTAGHVDAGTNTITLTMGTNSTSGDIKTGHMTANNMTVSYSGVTSGTTIDLGQSDIANNLTVTSSGRDITNTSGTLIVRNLATINAGTTGNITFTNANTDFNILSVTANVAAIKDTNAMQIGTTVTQGNYTLTVNGPVASYSNQTMTVGGMATFTANNGGFGYADPYVNLPNNNDFQGGITIAASSVGQSGTGGWAYVKDINALAVGNVSMGSYLTIVTGGAITQNSGTTITVPTYTTLTAGNSTTQYDITLDGTNNDFGSSNGSGSSDYSNSLYRVTIPYAKNVTLVDKNSFEFGTCNITGNLNLTAGEDIWQYYYRYYDYARITVSGTTTFTANNASSAINLYLGPDDPFYTGNPGSANNFTGTVTLARSSVNTGFTNIQLRNISSSASVLAGLTSVGTLNNVYLTYNNAPAVTLPGMTLTGSLKVYAPSVAGTASTPANIISQTGPIVVAGDTLVQAASTGDIILDNSGNNFNRINVIGARDATIVDSNAIVLYGSQSSTTSNYYPFSVARNLTITAGGSITDSSAYDPSAYISVAGGTASFTAGSSNDVILDNYYNRWSTMMFPSARNVQAGSYYTSINLNNSTIAGTLYLYGYNSYNLTQTSGSTVTTGSTTTFANFYSITLAEANNVFGPLAITGGSAWGTYNIRENDAITQASAWSLPNNYVYLTTSGNQAITLSQGSNQLRYLTLTQASTTDTTTASAGAVNVVTTGYTLSQNSAWTTRGTTTINTSGSALSLTDSANIFGPLQILGGGTTYLYAKDWTDTASAAHNAITDVGGTGAWSTGYTDLRAYNSAGSATSGTINLLNTSNSLGDLTLYGGTVTITNNAAITDYASGSGYSGYAWNTSGTTTLDSRGNAITLDNYYNVIGPIAITGTSAGTHPSSVYITDSNNIDQASAWTIGTATVTLDSRSSAINLTQTANVLGAITILTTPSSNFVPSAVSITEDDAITQGNTWTFKPNSGTTTPVTLVTTGGQAISLGSLDNILGNLIVTQNGAGTGAVSIREIDTAGITQAGAWTTRGTTTLDTNAVINLPNASNVLGAITVNGAYTPTAVTITENDDITQASAWSVGTAPVALNAGTHQILMTQANNVLGNVALSGAASVISIRENDAITQNSIWDIGTTAITLATSNDQAITLNQNNVLGGLAITQYNTGASSFGAVLVTEADTNGITQSGPWTVHGVTTLNAGTGNPIILTQANNVLANVAISGAPSSFSLTEDDAITQESVWSVGTAPVNLVTTNAQAITLGGQDNVLGNLTVTQNGNGSGAVAIKEKDSTNGVTQGATPWLTLGATSIDASGYGINLANKDNVFGPLQLVGGTANGTSVTLYAKETAGHDAITDVGAAGAWLTGTTTLYAYDTTGTTAGGGDIVLTNASNSLGDLNLKGTTVTITENGTITDGAAGWQATGTTTFNPGANAIVLDNTANTLGPIAINNATTAVTITEADDVTQASAWNLPSAPVTLAATGYSILLTQAANQLGDLKLTAQNATVVENHPITDGSAWTVPGTTTLTAGTNAIVLDANPRSDFGTVKIVSASNADIADVNGIIFDTTSVAGTLTVTAGGAITQTANAITAGSLAMSGTGASATLNTPTNNIGTISASFTSGGGLSYTDADNVQLLNVAVGANPVSLTSVAGTYTGLNTLSSSTNALTINTGAALTVPALNIAGLQSYTAGGGGILLDGSLNSTASGAIDFYSPVTLNRDLTISSTGSPITFHSTVAGGTNDLGVNAGASAITFMGAVSNLGDSLTSNAALTVTATSGSTIFQSTLSANNGLLVSGPSTFEDTVTLQNGGIGSTFTGEVTLGKIGGMTLSGYKYMDFNSGIVLENGPATILTNDYPLRFSGGTVHGPFALTLNAGTGESATITGLSRMGSNLTSLTATAYNLTIPSGGITINGPQTYTANSGTNITLTGNVTSTASGAITFNSPVNVTGTAAVTCVDSTISFMDTLDGTKQLTINSGTAAKSVVGKVGSINSLGDASAGAALILQGSGATTFSDTVVARAGITSAGAVTFNGDVTLANGSTGSAFTGRVTTGAAIAAINGYDGLAFNGGLTLGADLTVTSNGSTISFGNTVLGAHELTLNALATGAGTVTGLDQIGTASGLTKLTITGQTLSLPSVDLAVSGPMSFTAVGGITLNGNVGSSSSPATGQIDFNGPVLLATGPIVVTTANAPINFAGTVNGARALTVNAGTSTTTFAGSVGGTTPLASLTASGTTAINGGVVSTSGAQLYNNAVTLGANTTFNGSALTFGGTLNGGYTLLANVSGATTFDGIVGGVTPLTSITTDAPGSVVFNTSSITTTGAQTYNELITLGADAVLSGTTIRLLGGIDGAHALTINDLGTTTLGTVGGTTPLSALTVTANALNLNGDVTAVGDVTITGPTTLGADLTISTAGVSGDDITFSGPTSTINGAHDLTLQAGFGNVVLGGVVGGITPLGGVTVSGNDLTIPLVSSTGSQMYSAENNLTLSQSRTSGVPLTFNADYDGDGSGSFILLNGVSLVTSNQPLVINAADLDLQGSSTISTGSGLITITPTNARNLFIGGTDSTAMSISASELSRISTSGGIDFKTTSSATPGSGWIKVAGIGAADSQNISGVIHLNAQGSGDVSFVTSASTFNPITAETGSGVINLGQNLSTSNDPIIFASPVVVNGMATVASAGGSIDFQNTLLVSNPLTLNTSGGALTFGGQVGGTSTLTASIAGGAIAGLNQLQSTLTGLTLSNSATVTLPAIAINGPQVYNGPISISGNLTGIGLTFNNTAQLAANNLTLDSATGTLAFNNTLSAGANNLTLTGDEIDFANTVTGTGNLTLQPSTTSLGVLVGGSAATASLDITAADLSWLPSNLGGLIIGRTTGTGTLAIAAPTGFNATPLTLNGLGGISQSGPLTAGVLLLRSNAGINLSDTANSLGAISIGGTPASVNIAESTDITQGAAWVLGTAPVTLNSGVFAITLTQNGNTFGTLALTGGTVTVKESADTDLGASSATNLTVTSTGAISTSGTVAVSDTAIFKTLDNTGKSITIANGSTFGLIGASSRNAADSALSGGQISIAPANAVLLGTLGTTADIILTAASGQTISEDGSSVLDANGLALLGAGGQFDLISGTNAITTLAGNTDLIGFRENSGFVIGTVVGNVGVVITGDTTLSSTGTVTQTQRVAAAGLELLGTGGSFTLTDSGNAITTLAGNTGAVSFTENSGFAIGTVNTTGLTTSGNTTLTTTGTVTQSQKITAAGFELLGVGGTFTLTNPDNAITTLAGSTGVVSFVENSGFGIGSVNSSGLATSGNLTLSSTGTVTQSQDLSAAGLELLGTGGSFVLSRDTNTIPLLAGNTGSANVHTSGALVIGSVNTNGFTTATDLTLNAGGAITQTQVIAIGRNLALTTTHAAGNVTIDNSGASATFTGDTLIGGDYNLIATGDPVSQAPSTYVQVAGNLTITSASATLDGAANLIGGTTSLPGTNSTYRAGGVITLNDLNVTGNYTVISEATSRGFGSGAIGGTAIDLNNAANHVTGTISVNTTAPSITSGAQAHTGILQAAGTSIQISGNASFTAEASSAGSDGVILTNAGNMFGTLRASGNIINIVDSSSASVIAGLNGTTSTTFVATGAVTQSGAIITPTLSLTSGGSATLTNTANQVSTVTLDGSGGIAYTDTDSFVVAGINAHGNSVALTAGGTGAITQTGAMQNVTALTVISGGAATLSNTSNTLDSLAAVTSGGAAQIFDSAGGLTVSGAVAATTGDVTIRTSGNLTLGASSSVTATAGNVYVSTEGAGNFVNNAGIGVFTVGTGGRWLVYSKTPDLVGTIHTEKGGLTSSFRLYGKTYSSEAPGSVTETGNGFIYADSPSTSLTISPTVTGTASHIYGDTPTATLGYTVTGGLVDSEDTIGSIGITGTATFDVTGSTTYHALSNAMNADSYTVKFTGGLTSNYTMVADTTGVSYTVNQATLTYNAHADSRTYGSANPSLTGTITGFKLTDSASSLGGTISWTTTADGTSNVGGYGITGSGYTSSNYTFSQAAGNATALTVTARPITLTAVDQSRTYGDANPATGSYTITSGNLVNSDALATTVSVTSPATLTSHVGGYALNPSGASFTTGAASNYSINYAAGTLNVTARPITLTATTQSRVYGNANPTTGGFSIGGSGLANIDALNASLTVSSPAVATSNVGSYTLTPSNAVFSTGVATDYAITYADGSLSVSARPITITANDQSRYYGNANPTTGGFIVGGSGFVNSDALNPVISVSSLATPASHVGNYTLIPGAVTFTTGLSSNYTVTYANGGLSITARPITLTANDQTRIYGDANPTTGSFTIGGLGLGNSDALAALLTVTSPATLASHVGNYTLTPSAAVFTTGSASDYAITYTAGTLGVAARPITLTANDQNRFYGNANPATGTYTIGGSGLANTDVINANLTVTSPAVVTSNVGSYTLTPSNAVFTTGAATDYAVTYADGRLFVTPRPITITASNQSRSYGNANPATGGFAVGGSGLVNSDALNPVISISSPATLTSHVGNYTLSPSAVTFTTGLSSNYAVTYVDGSLSVTARAITLTASNQTRIYGDANPTTGTFTVGGGGLVNSDALSALLTVTSPATLTSHVGNYTLTPSAAVFTTGAASDYAITYAAGTLGVTARPITLTANDQSRIYGNANPTTGGFTIGGSGLANTDALNASLTVTSPAVATSNVGSFSLTPSGAVFSSGAASDYTMTYADGSLSITPRPITITASNQSRYYGDANPATGGFAVGGSGLVNSDALNPVISVSSPATLTDHVGSYTLSPGTVSFTTGLSSNYTVAYADGSLAVTARPITLTADNQTRTYGDANPTSGTFTIGGLGLVNSDELSASLAVTSPAIATSNVGNYALTPSGAVFTAGNASDYAVSYGNGILGVTPAVLTYTADPATRIYGNANPAFTGTVTGFKNGETLATATTGAAVFTSPASLTSNVGSYAIDGSGLTANNGNYTFVQAASSATALSITPRPLTVTAIDLTRYYGDANPATLAATSSGLVNGDTIASAGATTPATVTSNVGSYTITPNSANFSVGFASNYTISYVSGTMVVTPRPVTITASNQSRYYGDANPTTGGFIVGGSGLANTDTLAPTLLVSSPAVVTSSVGNYTLAPSTVSFTTGLASNYAVSYANGVLAVTPRPLTVTPVATSKVYGEANPVADAVTGNNLVNGDTLGVSLVTSLATATSNVGAYGLTTSLASFTQGAAGNYAITYAPGVLTVTPRPVDVTANTQTKVYGAADPTLTYQTEVLSAGRGLLTGQTLSGSLTRTAGENVAGGPYAITIGTLTTSNSNYTISFTGSSLTITPAVLTYVASMATGNNSANVPNLTGTITGFVRGDTLATATTGNALWATTAELTSNPGAYPVTGSGLAAINGNYTFTQAAGNATALIIVAGTSSLLRPVIPEIDAGSGLSGFESLVGVSPTAVFGTLIQNELVSPFVSTPSDTGSLTLYGSQITVPGAIGSGEASFTSEGNWSIMLLAPGSVGTTDTEPTSANVKVPLYLDSAGSDFLVGSFMVNEAGNVLAMTSIEDGAGTAANPLATGLNQKAVYILNTASAAPVQIEVVLSDDGVLLVKVPASFIQARGVKQVALAGIRAARQELQAPISSFRVIKIVPLQ